MGPPLQGYSEVLQSGFAQAKISFAEGPDRLVHLIFSVGRLSLKSKQKVPAKKLLKKGDER